MREIIDRCIADSINAKKTIPAQEVEDACKRIIECYKRGGKIMICGNGGSAGDSQHMAGELVNRFLIERKPWACIALTTDSSILTAIGNDYSFDEVFSKQVEALGNKDDILLGISTSGKSRNVRRAIESAKINGIYTIGLLGKDGGDIAMECDLPIVIRINETPRIQECHILIIHMICEIVEKELVSLNF